MHGTLGMMRFAGVLQIETMTPPIAVLERTKYQTDGMSAKQGKSRISGAWYPMGFGVRC